MSVNATESLNFSCVLSQEDLQKLILESVRKQAAIVGLPQIVRLPDTDFTIDFQHADDQSIMVKATITKDVGNVIADERPVNQSSSVPMSGIR